MTSQACEHARGLIALSVMDRLPTHERPGLIAHLDGCDECRQDERELRALAAVLPTADTDRFGQDELPAGLAGTVLGRLRTEERRHRRTRRVQYAIGGAVAAAAVGLGLVLSLGTPGGPARTLTLSGTPGVHASVTLTPQPWGTAVHVEESGQPGGQVMSVSMRTTWHTWWDAGNYTSVAGHRVEVDLACGLSSSRVESVWVHDAAGHAVLHAYVT